MANGLLDARSRFAQEFANNPDLQRKLQASIQAEVGDQSSAAQLAYVESVMNRATARGMTLDQTISDPNYYPKSTLSQLGTQVAPTVTMGLNALVNQAMSGSNISNFATGNESGKVHSGGAPVAFVSPAPGKPPEQAERFVVENKDQDWAAASGASLPVAGTGMTSVPSLASSATTTATSQDDALTDFYKKRMGLMN